MSKLPKNPEKGRLYTIEVDTKNKNLGKRSVTFRATGEKGFGKFKIVNNEPATKHRRRG